MTDSKKNLFVDVHAVQTVPPANLNRDDTNSPKTATYGGVRRLRVSSQSWKKAMRDYFAADPENRNIGVRTLFISDLVLKAIQKRDPSKTYDEALELSDSVLRSLYSKKNYEKNVKVIEADSEDNLDGKKHLKNNALFFMSTLQADRLAGILLDGDLDEKERDKQIRNALKTDNSVDQALFGRMVADSTALNVDAAAQVAHAIGVQKAQPEFDFFTAVDDHKLESDDHAGAGMMGTVEFSSSTLYRFADVSLSQLEENLGDKGAVADAVVEFVDAFANSVPSGKQNTFAAQTLPATLVVTLRDSRPISYVGAFEKPIEGDSSADVTTKAVAAMADYAVKTQSAYDLRPLGSWVVYLDEVGKIVELGDAVNMTELKQRLHDAVLAAM